MHAYIQSVLIDDALLQLGSAGNEYIEWRNEKVVARLACASEYKDWDFIQ